MVMAMATVMDMVTAMAKNMNKIINLLIYKFNGQSKMLKEICRLRTTCKRKINLFITKKESEGLYD